MSIPLPRPTAKQQIHKWLETWATVMNNRLSEDRGIRSVANIVWKMTLRLTRLRVFHLLGWRYRDPSDWNGYGSIKMALHRDWSIAVLICCDLGSSPLQSPALDVSVVAGHHPCSPCTCPHRYRVPRIFSPFPRFPKPSTCHFVFLFQVTPPVCSWISIGSVASNSIGSMVRADGWSCTKLTKLLVLHHPSLSLLPFTIRLESSPSFTTIYLSEYSQPRI